MKGMYQLVLLAFLMISCGDDGSGGMPTGPTPTANLPEITILNARVLEGQEESTAILNLTLDVAASDEVSVGFTTVSKTAVAGADFMASEGTVSFPAGSTSARIDVPILVDTDKEIEETFDVFLRQPQGATIGNTTGIVTITDNDVAVNDEGDGYVTASVLDGYNLTWSDEFDGDVLDESSWTFEIGDGCAQGICGWGNNELQIYSDSEENLTVADGIMTITARPEAPFSSSRIISQDKREFEFGRIDVRARLPRGQGIWPAIWMLGVNISEVGWPASGEIDIMELVGHQASTSHGTAHWGRAGEGSRSSSRRFDIREDFAERFHVFTILWKQNSIQWYVDETLFHEIDNVTTQGFAYPFNQDFFFILNVAVGGNWPGNPDDTTVFPQTMEVDYIRVFQES